MNQIRPPKIVMLGAMSTMPVAGIVYLTMQYVLGFQRLGYEVYYVEAHGRTPSIFMQRPEDDSSALAAGFLATIMQRFDMEGRWCLHALHDDGRCYGMSERALKRLYREAALIINLHGSTQPLPEHSATGRLVYLGTDPVKVEVDLYHNVPHTIALLEPHCAFFTWGENYGNPDCLVPVSERFRFRPTRQPIILDLWKRNGKQRPPDAAEAFTTIGNWQQGWRPVKFRGETYTWSKHYEFRKFIDLPSRGSQPFELALSTCSAADRRMLEEHGWRVRDALRVSREPDDYRCYIQNSRGEFTVAKDQNIRLRSGWFSDRSACYLAAGRPVVTQETGFSNILPTGEGLFAFSTMNDVLQAVEVINGNYGRHSRAAYEIAREYFSYDGVLPQLLAEVG